MNKIGFLFSGILFIIGVITALTTKIINLVMPKIGYIAFQFTATGSYNPNSYNINFSGVNSISIGIIISSIVMAVVFYRLEQTKQQ